MPPDPPADDDVRRLFASCSPEVRDLGLLAWATIRRLLPDATEELDEATRMVGFTYHPGTYAGLIVGVVPQRTYVNIMFSRGVELLATDPTGLLEGTGKVARHVKTRRADQLDDPALHALIVAAAAATPR